MAVSRPDNVQQKLDCSLDDIVRQERLAQAKAKAAEAAKRKLAERDLVKANEKAKVKKSSGGTGLHEEAGRASHPKKVTSTALKPNTRFNVSRPPSAAIRQAGTASQLNPLRYSGAVRSPAFPRPGYPQARISPMFDMFGEPVARGYVGSPASIPSWNDAISNGVWTDRPYRAAPFPVSITQAPATHRVHSPAPWQGQLEKTRSLGRDSTYVETVFGGNQVNDQQDLGTETSMSSRLPTELHTARPSLQPNKSVGLSPVKGRGPGIGGQDEPFRASASQERLMSRIKIVCDLDKIPEPLQQQHGAPPAWPQRMIKSHRFKEAGHETFGGSASRDLYHQSHRRDPRSEKDTYDYVSRHERSERHTGEYRRESSRERDRNYDKYDEGDYDRDYDKEYEKERAFSRDRGTTYNKVSGGDKQSRRAARSRS